MFVVVRDYLQQHQALLIALPGMEGFMQSFVDILLKISKVNKDLVLDNSGNTLHKNKLKKELAMMAADNSRKLKAYATFTHNYLLQGQVSYSESILKRVPDNELLASATVIYEKAQDYLDELALYGIDSDSQLVLKTSMAGFEASFSAPRIGKVETSSDVQQLAGLFRDATAVLENIDLAIDIIRLKEPAFYLGYKIVRKLVKTGVTKLSLKGSVTDAATGMPLVGAKVTISLVNDDGSETVVFVKKSARKGGFKIHHAAQGNYTVVAQRPGYKDAKALVSIVSGKMSQVTLAMELV